MDGLGEEPIRGAKLPPRHHDTTSGLRHHLLLESSWHYWSCQVRVEGLLVSKPQRYLRTPNLSPPLPHRACSATVWSPHPVLSSWGWHKSWRGSRAGAPP